MHPLLLSLGSINADFQVRVDRVPGTGSTLLGRDFMRLSGGKAANRAVVAARLGLAARLLGRVGDDELREQALAPLRELGVNINGVSVARGCATAVSMIAVLPDGKKSIVLAGNANETWDEAAISAIEAAIQQADDGALLAVDFEVPPEVATRAIAAAHHRVMPVTVDPSPPGRVTLALLAGVAAVSRNPKEAEALTGIVVDSPNAAAQAARKLHEAGVKLACVKLADGGCVVVTPPDGCLHVPPLEVQPVDTTGAGDAFAGALAVAVLERQPPLEAACFAVAASSLAVTKYGSQPACPERERVDPEMRGLIARARRIANET